MDIDQNNTIENFPTNKKPKSIINKTFII